MRNTRKIACTLLSAAMSASILAASVPVNAFADTATDREWTIVKLFDITDEERQAFKQNLNQLRQNGTLTVEKYKEISNTLHDEFSGKSFDELVNTILTKDVSDELFSDLLILSSTLFKDVNGDALVPDSLHNEVLEKIDTAFSAVSIWSQIYDLSDDDSKKTQRDVLSQIIKTALRDAVEKIEDGIDQKIREIKETASKTPEDTKEQNPPSGEQADSGSDSQTGTSGSADTDKQSGSQTGTSGSADTGKQSGSQTGLPAADSKDSSKSDSASQTQKDNMKATSSEPTAVYFKKGEATLYVKGKVQIVPDIYHAKGVTTYKSKNAKIAAVNAKGLVTAKKKGTTKIVVTNNGKTNYFTVTVKNPVLNKSNITLKKGKSFKLKVKTGLIGKAKFKSSKKTVAKVSKSGKVKALKKGKAVITVTANGVKLKCKVTVK